MFQERVGAEFRSLGVQRICLTCLATTAKRYHFWIWSMLWVHITDFCTYNSQSLSSSFVSSTRYYGNVYFPLPIIVFSSLLVMTVTPWRGRRCDGKRSAALVAPVADLMTFSQEKCCEFPQPIDGKHAIDFELFHGLLIHWSFHVMSILGD